ncbi:hypothetical protein BN59_02763 [Legionella massiliensis]|uniref:Uncharacterized protein n=1 Tax=Legionella massiliensis TaxID=1034943 RepID=A0A078L3D7_9GAMM|nr:hypothetical protein [Legionella massiliensis]CDZ78453.1 hypothetical protein BN59_02763 [Legionella massiliensis]CEE14191.1 hypothetical protein BN1094_02763 [Legionella massiliensis]
METYIFTFNNLKTFRKYEEIIKRRVRNYGLPPDLVSFDSNQLQMKFKFLSLAEIHYIFDLGHPPGKSKALQFATTTGSYQETRDYRNYRESKTDEIADTFQHYKTRYSPQQARVAEIDLKENWSLQAIAEFLEASNEELPSDWLISEDHAAFEPKKIIISSIDFLREHKGILLLEHLCFESMQAELDASLKRLQVSAALKKYLNSLDQSFYRPNKNGEGPFYQLVNQLITNGIKVVALDSQITYAATPNPNGREGISAERRMANIEWKKRRDTIREAFPDSLILSLVGDAHTSQISSGHDDGIMQYNELIGGLHLPIRYGQCRSLYLQPVQPSFNIVGPESSSFLLSSLEYQKYSIFFALIEQLIFTNLKNDTQEEAKFDILNYQNIDKDEFSLGRMPATLLPTFLQTFSLVPDEITTLPSKYKGPFNNDCYLKVIIKKEALQKILSMDIESIYLSSKNFVSNLQDRLKGQENVHKASHSLGSQQRASSQKKEDLRQPTLLSNTSSSNNEEPAQAAVNTEERKKHKNRMHRFWSCLSSNNRPESEEDKEEQRQGLIKTTAL